MTHERKTPRRPSAPKATHLPARGRQETKEGVDQARRLSATAGVKKTNAPDAGQWRSLTSTRANERGAHDTARPIHHRNVSGVPRRTGSSTGHPDAGLVQPAGPHTTKSRARKYHFRSRADARYIQTRDRNGNTCHGSRRGGADAASQASKRGTPSQALEESRRLTPSQGVERKSGTCASLHWGGIGAGSWCAGPLNGQLRPNVMPVGRPQINPSHCAAGGALNLHGPFLRHGSAIDPARHDRLRDTDGFPKSGVGKTLFAQVVREFHARTIADSFTFMQ